MPSQSNHLNQKIEPTSKAMTEVSIKLRSGHADIDILVIGEVGYGAEPASG
jgi:hypothetical protein